MSNERYNDPNHPRRDEGDQIPGQNMPNEDMPDQEVPDRHTPGETTRPTDTPAEPPTQNAPPEVGDGGPPR